MILAFQAYTFIIFFVTFSFFGTQWSKTVYISPPNLQGEDPTVLDNYQRLVLDLTSTPIDGCLTSSYYYDYYVALSEVAGRVHKFVDELSPRSPSIYLAPALKDMHMYLNYEKAMCRPVPMLFEQLYTCFLYAVSTSTLSDHVLDLASLVALPYVTEKLMQRRINLFSGLHQGMLVLSDVSLLYRHREALAMYAHTFRYLYDERMVNTTAYGMYLTMLQTVYTFVATREEDITKLDTLLRTVEMEVCQYPMERWWRRKKYAGFLRQLIPTLFATYTPYLGQFMEPVYGVFRSKYVYYLYALMDLQHGSPMNRNYNRLMSSICFHTHPADYRIH